MKQLQKIAYIKSFMGAGIEDQETTNALKFMDNFYKHDRSNEPRGFNPIHSRPDSQLSKMAFNIKRPFENLGSRGQMNNAVGDLIKEQKRAKRKKIAKGVLGAGAVVGAGLAAKAIYDKKNESNSISQQPGQ